MSQFGVMDFRGYGSGLELDGPQPIQVKIIDAGQATGQVTCTIFRCHRRRALSSLDQLWIYHWETFHAMSRGSTCRCPGGERHPTRRESTATPSTYLQMKPVALSEALVSSTSRYLGRRFDDFRPPLELPVAISLWGRPAVSTLSRTRRGSSRAASSL